MTQILKRQKNKKTATLVLFALAKRHLEESERRVWCKSYILLFGRNRHYENVYNEWRYHDSEEFRAQLRIYPECFKMLPIIENRIYYSKNY